MTPCFGCGMDSDGGLRIAGYTADLCAYCQGLWLHLISALQFESQMTNLNAGGEE